MYQAGGGEGRKGKKKNSFKGEKSTISRNLAFVQKELKRVCEPERAQGRKGMVRKERKSEGGKPSSLPPSP